MDKMTDITPYEENNPEGRKPILWDRSRYLEHVGKLIYGDLDPNNPANFRELYRRAYATFQHNQGKLISIDRNPPSPEKVDDASLEEELTMIEIDCSIFFGGGLGVLCMALGRDPKEVLDRKMEDEE